MAKWYGKIGYITTNEVEPGVWASNAPIEKSYDGDILSNSSRWASSNKVNDDLNVSNRISIVADPFAFQNFQSIKYIEFMSGVWEVSNIEVQYPRLILTVGGVYNGERAQADTAI